MNSYTQTCWPIFYCLQQTYWAYTQGSVSLWDQPHVTVCGISMIGCHWFHWHLSPQWDKLQHELLKTYTCRSVSWLHQIMHVTTLLRAERSHGWRVFNPFWQSATVLQTSKNTLTLCDWLLSPLKKKKISPFYQRGFICFC